MTPAIDVEGVICRAFQQHMALLAKGQLMMFAHLDAGYALVLSPVAEGVYLVRSRLSFMWTVIIRL